MKSLVVYESMYGNTEKIARAIAGALGAEALHVSSLKPEHLNGISLLIAGSPTQKFSPLPGMTAWMKNLPPGVLKGVQAGAFDTRFPEEMIKKQKTLNFFVSIFGYAAKKIGNGLVKKGAALSAPPEGFLVKDIEGPLFEGELERAAQWAKQFITGK